MAINETNETQSLDETIENGRYLTQFQLPEASVDELARDSSLEAGYLVFYNPENSTDALYAGAMPVDKSQEFDPANPIHCMLMLYASFFPDVKIVKFSRSEHEGNQARQLLEARDIQSIYAAFATIQEGTLEFYRVQESDGITNKERIPHTFANDEAYEGHKKRVEEIAQELDLVHSKPMEYR